MPAGPCGSHLLLQVIRNKQSLRWKVKARRAGRRRSGRCCCRLRHRVERCRCVRGAIGRGPPPGVQPQPTEQSEPSAKLLALIFLFRRPPAIGSRPATVPISRSPAPLLLAVAAVPHAAPLPAMALARVDKVDIAVGGAAFADHASIDADQQILDFQGAGVQRQIACRRRKPLVSGHAFGGGDQRSCGMCLANGRSYRAECVLRDRLMPVRCGQHFVESLAEFASALGNSRARRS
jgi:hypothetical protein